MPLAIDDGYALPFATLPDARPDAGDDRPTVTGLPVVAGRYRPAVFEEVQEFQYQLDRAATGAEQAELIAAFVAAHVADWDVTLGGKPAPVTAKTVRRFPAPVVEQLVAVVSKWAAKEQDAAAGNS